MLVIPVMVTPASGGLETIVTIGIQNVGGTEEVGDYKVTVDGVIRADVKGFERDRGAMALVREALEAIELNSDRSKTFISRPESKGKHLK